MAIRWLHKAWSKFWTIIGISLVTLLVVGSLGFGVLQLKSTKNFIADRIEKRFNDQHNGVLKFGEIEGTIPFSFQLANVSLYPDSSSYTPVFSSDTISASLDVWSLVRNDFVITGLNVISPKMILDGEGNASFISAIRKKEGFIQSVDTTDAPSPFVEVLAPTVKVHDGEVIIRNLVSDTTKLFKSDSLSLQNITMDLFLDYSENQRYLDIEKLTMNSPQLGNEEISLFGQVFNDERFLEFNSFNIRKGNSVLRFRGEADGVDIFKEDLFSQILGSELDIALEELIVQAEDIESFYPDFSNNDKNAHLSFNGVGTLDSLNVDRFQMLLGESGLIGYGHITNALDKELVGYGFNLQGVLLDSNDVRTFLPELTELQLQAILSSQYEAEVHGDKDFIDSKISVLSNRGSVNLEGKAELGNESPIEFAVALDSLDLGGLISERLEESNLSGTTTFSTSSTDFRNATGWGEIFLQNSSINGVSIDTLSVTGNWTDGLIFPSFKLIDGNSRLDGIGTVNVRDSIPEIEFSGIGEGIDLKALTQLDNMAKTRTDIDYEFFLNGSTRDDLYGQLSVNVPFSIVGIDTLPAHQIYADFTEPESNNRIFRLTSTILDVSISGEFSPEKIYNLSRYWKTYFEERIAEEIRLSNFEESIIDYDVSGDQNIALNLNLKDTKLINSYFPDSKIMSSSFNMSSDLNINSSRLLFNAEVQDPALSLNNFMVDSIAVQVTGSFRHEEKLKSFSGLQLQATAASLSTDYISGKGVEFAVEMNEDSIEFSHSIDQIAEDTKFEMNGNVNLSDTSIQFNLSDFDLGSDTYRWANQGTPILVYNEQQKLIFQDFEFTNLNEFLSFDGVFSNQSTDSVNYVIQNVNLARISDLVNGRIDFSGILDGRFTTRSLTRTPTIQGELGISSLSIDENIVGDLSIESNFNSDLNRFDTEILIATDSTKYPEYFIRNRRNGQDIRLAGYILAPERGQFPDVDSLYSFDLDFESIDLWVIPFIAPKVFTEMSGKATGRGMVWGNTDTYDFSIDYEIGMDDAVYIKPRFLDTYYYAQGFINFSRTEGLKFDETFIIDPSGGLAVLNGTYNLNDFQQIHTIDLMLEMDEFQFLNNSFDPNIPFFGKTYGSSTVRMSGTNLNPVLSTVTPMNISDFSTIGIPLLEETEFDEDNKFIRFIDDPSMIKVEKSKPIANVSAFGTIDSEDNPFERTFIERFTLDLQFIATRPMSIELIFDPITGDVIKTDGTGRVSIRLEDEQLSMFGQFDISGGNYQFVSGDIFSRRFDLEPGGTIIWDGSPTDARLNLNAIYEARPDINTLTSARADIDRDNSQRVPVELVLNVGGSLSSIENEFFFRLPNAFETRQNSAIRTQISNLNRNEDEKLIQATSFLLMGDFIPSTSASSDATNSLTNNLSGSAAVLNPLLSSQVISPLLSNQINSLLRSDIGSLDIDFNLNTYNNVDLDVALRLYNDRIILSREGQITGSQSNIGDLGATYRINQTLSVTAFHRQDPTFSNYSSTEESQQSQDINGVGLEAEVSFNSWSEFFRKVAKPFRRLFRGKGKKEEVAEANTTNDASE